VVGRARLSSESGSTTADSAVVVGQESGIGAGMGVTVGGKLDPASNSTVPAVLDIFDYVPSNNRKT
jgi:hypothetical protein